MIIENITVILLQLSSASPTYSVSSWQKPYLHSSVLLLQPRRDKWKMSKLKLENAYCFHFYETLQVWSSSVFWTFYYHTMPYHSHQETVTPQEHRRCVLRDFQVYFKLSVCNIFFLRDCRWTKLFLTTTLLAFSLYHEATTGWMLYVPRFQSYTT